MGRFIQADTLIPGVYNPLALDRYAYVQNNPIRSNDPTGHDKCTGNQDFLPDCETINGEWTRDWSVGEDDPYFDGDLGTKETFTAIGEGIDLVGSIVVEPYDWYLTGRECLNGDCSPLALLGLLPFIPGSKADDIVDLITRLDGVTLSVDDTLDLAINFLG